LLWQLLQQLLEGLQDLPPQERQNEILRHRHATADSSAVRGAPVSINMPGVPLAIRALQAQGFMKGRVRRLRPAWGGAGAIHLKAVSNVRRSDCH
jgi:hypothetical protein